MGYAVAARWGVEAGLVREAEGQAYSTDVELDRIPEDVEELGEAIAILAAHVHAGTQRLLALIARFHRLEGWVAGGHRSCAHWLSERTGLDLGTAREHVRVALRLEGLPRTRAAMSHGELSFSQVRALTRVATAEAEADLVELARGCTTEQLERMVRAWKKWGRKDEAALERERHGSRKLSVFPDEEGMYVIHGRLDAEVGAAVQRAVDAATDELYRLERRDGRTEAEGAPRAVAGERGLEPVRDTAREAARRRADAIGLVAEAALAALTGRDRVSGSRDGARETFQRERGDTFPLKRGRAERYRVVLHVDADTLSADREPGRSELEDGTRVSAETSRRIACDAGLVRVTHAAGRMGGGKGQARADESSRASGRGRVLDVGRKTRTISPALRRALEVRDRGCRFPGCGSRYTEAHHVVHWADGGETSLGNTVLLCRFHHRLVHEEGWQVKWLWDDTPAFVDPRGSIHAGRSRGGRRSGSRSGAAPVTTTGPGSAAELIAANRARGIDPDGSAAPARWTREADIPDDILFRAVEAGLQ